MLNVQTTEFIISFSTFLLAYMAAVTFSGAFKAWVAEQVGDETAASVGLTTLNPMMHIDPTGVVILFVSYIFLGIFFGWGRNIPINHMNIEGRHRTLKILAAYFSDTFMYIFSALMGIIGLIATLGPKMLNLSLWMLQCRLPSHSLLVSQCPTFSSLAITLSFIVIAFVYLNVILAALTFLINSFQVGLFLVIDRSTEYREPNFYILIFGPMVLIFFLSEPLRNLIIHLIAHVAFGISNLFGLI